MNMIRSLLLPLFYAAAVCFGWAEETPVWEIYGRLDPKAESPLHTWVKKLIAEQIPIPETTTTAEIHIAGFEIKDEPHDGWLIEIKNFTPSATLLEEIAKKAKSQNQGRYLLEEDGTEFLVWRDSDSSLRLVSPPASADIKLFSAHKPEPNVILSGWIDLKRISRKNIESETLKLPETLRFSAASQPKGIDVSLQASFSDPALAAVGRRVLTETFTQIQQEIRETSDAPPPPAISIEGQDKEISLKAQFNEAQLRSLTEWIDEAIHSP